MATTARLPERRTGPTAEDGMLELMFATHHHQAPTPPFRFNAV